MLVLTRRKNEEIVVRTPEGREIVIAPVEIRRDKVRLGFKADREVSVNRREVQDEIDENQGRQSCSPPPHLSQQKSGETQTASA